MALLTAERNRLPTALPPVRERISAHIAWLEEELAAIDGELARTIRDDSTWRERVTQAALDVIGAWDDLDWDELEAALDRIRHQSHPTPPIEL